MDTPNFRLLASTRDVCGEGCVWHPEEDAVYWTDINRGLLHRYRLQTKTVETWSFDQPVTAVLLTTQEHVLALVLGGCIILWDSHRCQKTGDILFELPGWPLLRCNDARVDPHGILWFGTMQNNVLADGSTGKITAWQGALYSLRAGEQATLQRSGFGITNTIAWSPDGGTMYFGDTLANQIYRVAYDPDRIQLEGCESFFADFPRGLPDGSAMDAEGYLWNCRFGGACIVRIAPDGSIAKVIETPVLNPTTCTFAGRDADTLIFTSAAAAEARDLSGDSLFAFETGTSGLHSTPLRL